jgi:hypothetical protein
MSSLRLRKSGLICSPAVLRRLWVPEAALPGIMRPFPGGIVSVAGSQNFTAIGSSNFTVPVYTSLTAQVWGGGGSGGQCSSSGFSGNVGNNSTFAGLVAGGGSAGGNGYSSDGVGGPGGGSTGGGVGSSNGTVGGNASGYNGGFGAVAPGMGGTQAPGGSYNYGNGSSATNWGAGGGGVGGFFGAQGGGGGGGSGAYTTRTYAPGELTPGSTVSVFVGFGGAAGASELGGFFGAGYQGLVSVSWT